MATKHPMQNSTDSDRLKDTPQHPAHHSDARQDPTRSGGSQDFTHLYGTPPTMHYLYEPSGMAGRIFSSWRSPEFQMRYSIQKLQHKLAKAGTPTLLQLVYDTRENCDWLNWKLYANGTFVAGGNKDFTQECFQKSSTAFMDVCRDAIQAKINQGKLPVFTSDEFTLLRAARRIAKLDKVCEKPADITGNEIERL